MGYPLRHDESGAGSCTVCPRGRVAVGLVAGLYYRVTRASIRMRPSIHQRLHPFVARSCLKSGTLLRYGAKAIPEGGWNTIPRPYVDGGLIAGDAGAFVNSLRLKGIHLAIAYRDAGCRDRVRGDSEPARLQQTRSLKYEKKGLPPVRFAPNCTRFVTCTRHSGSVWSPGAMFAELTTVTWVVGAQGET